MRTAAVIGIPGWMLITAAVFYAALFVLSRFQWACMCRNRKRPFVTPCLWSYTWLLELHPLEQTVNRIVR